MIEIFFFFNIFFSLLLFTGVLGAEYALWNGWLQTVGEAKTGDIVGEIGMLCYRPQLFTVRTKRLCQLLRLNRTAFLNIVQAHVGDGTIIMNNLLQVCKSCSTSNFPFLLSFLFFFFFGGGGDYFSCNLWLILFIKIFFISSEIFIFFPWF